MDVGDVDKRRTNRINSEIAYYTTRLADLCLLDQAVVVNDVVPEFLMLNGEITSFRCLPAYCVPVGGTRKAGCIYGIDDPWAVQHILDVLSTHPGFPNVRVDQRDVYSGVLWGDEFPAEPDRPDGFARMHREWLWGLHYGYSLRAILFHLGRLTAMEIVGRDEFLSVEHVASDGGQIRTHDVR